MKLLGFGTQFIIYDLGNGKVLRKPVPRFLAGCVGVLYHPNFLVTPWKISSAIDNSIKDREYAINWFSTYKYDKSLLGNLKISGDKIIQDKVTPLYKIIQKDFKKDKKIINSYCKLLLNSMKNGFLDREYNFSRNYGLDKKGEVVLIDFGEMRFTKSEAKKDILNEKWKIFLFRPWFMGKTRKYYIQKMQETLTIENLNKYWKKS